MSVKRIAAEMGRERELRRLEGRLRWLAWPAIFAFLAASAALLHKLLSPPPAPVEEIVMPAPNDALLDQIDWQRRPPKRP